MGRDIAGEREMRRTHGRRVVGKHLSSRGAASLSASDEANLFIHSSKTLENNLQRLGVSLRKSFVVQPVKKKIQMFFE